MTLNFGLNGNQHKNIAYFIKMLPSSEISETITNQISIVSAINCL